MSLPGPTVHGSLEYSLRRTETDAEDNHHSFIFLCFSDGDMRFFKAALSNTTAIAKSNREQSQRIMASGAVVDV